jgi:hypothetical protein
VKARSFEAEHSLIRQLTFEVGFSGLSGHEIPLIEIVVVDNYDPSASDQNSVKVHTFVCKEGTRGTGKKDLRRTEKKLWKKTSNICEGRNL